MRILIIGGTSFVGRAITEAAVAAGHEVTLFNRGQTASDEFRDVERLTGDRNNDLSALGGDRSWDATIDVCAYVPRHVRDLLELLDERAGHYTFISTVSVYDDSVPENYDENAKLLEPAWDDQLTMELYGQLKVACEQVAHELASGRLLVVRPGYVIGPHDPTHRFTYWVERIASGRSPMVSLDPDQPLQVVDARDLGKFTVDVTGRRVNDIVHVVGELRRFGEIASMVADATGAQVPELQPVDDDRLPLQIPRDYWSVESANPARSVELGLTWRSLRDSAADTLAWVKQARSSGGYQPREGIGLTEKEEQSLLTGG